MNGNVDTTTSPYYTDILKGMVVRFGNNGNGVDLNKLNSEINAKLPKGYDANWQEGDSFFIAMTNLLSCVHSSPASAVQTPPLML